MANSRRIENINGAALGPLSQVATVDSSKGLVANAVKNSPRDQKEATSSILDAVKQFIADSNEYQLKLDAKQSDIILGRIASLLDEVKESFTKTELADVKQEIIDEISSVSVSTVLKNFLMSQITEMFDSDAKKEDIKELKSWMQDNIKQEPQTASISNQTVEPKETIAVVEDEEKEDYRDSTPANNFYILQTFIQKQFDVLNQNLKNIPGQSGMFSKIKSIVSNSILSKIGNLTKKTLKIALVPIAAISTGVAAVSKGIKSVASGIGKIGSKVGGAIASPFKKIGGFFSKFNPFGHKDKKEEKKQKLRDKIMEKMSKIIDKVWKVIEPFIDMVTHFLIMAITTIVIPIALIAAKILLIIGAITLLAIGAYLVFSWVKEKITQFFNYVTSGQMWKDIKAKMIAAWEWMKDFGKWLWNITVDALSYLFVGMWVDLGKWVWEKLKQFGNWLYDNYIEKYIIKPLTDLIQPIANMWVEKIQPAIQPFINSLMNLKDKIVKAFSAWDTNKSIWENLKNISGIIKDSVVQWWEESPFKIFYEKHIQPFVESAVDLFNRLKNLGGFIKEAILDWWNGDSSLSETIGNIGGIVWQTIVDWWNTSIFKEYWDKLKVYLNDVMKPIKDWYDNSKLKEWIDKIKEIITTISSKAKELIDKMSGATWKLPMIGFVRPFGFLTGKSFKLSDEEAKEYENITKLQKTIANAGQDNAKIDDEIAKIEARLKAGDYAKDGAWFGKTKADLEKEIEQKKAAKIANENTIEKAQLTLQYNQAQQAKSLAQQQVQQAMQPIQSLDKMQTIENQNLQQNGKEISVKVEQKEEDNQQMSEEQLKKTDQLLEIMNRFMPQVLKKLDEPQATPVLVPYQSQSENNNANMAYY